MSWSGRYEAVVDAAPEQVWEVLTDVTRIGEWSHECHRAEWIDGATGPAVGARFRGRNRAGVVRWGRPCEIAELEPVRRLVYRTDGGLVGDCTEWAFDLEPVAGGTRIVQSFRILSLPRWAEVVICHLVPAHQDRSSGLTSDLERLGRCARGVAASERGETAPGRGRRTSQ